MATVFTEGFFELWLWEPSVGLQSRGGGTSEVFGKLRLAAEFSLSLQVAQPVYLSGF